MPKIIINDVAYEGQVGERIIDVARRNAAHIGTVCGTLGVFLFQMNACRVLSGTEHLSPPSEIEKNWLQPSWIEAGHRLACEAIIQGGPIHILSHAEELRRQTVSIFTPPEGTTSINNAGALFNTMGRIVLNQVVRLPFNVIGAVSLAGQARPEPDSQGMLSDIQKMLNDGSRVVQNMVGSKNTTDTPQQ